MKVFFGGPDKPPNLLCNLLAERIEAVPAGGEIFWATYYFGNLDLADLLVKARRKGVNVRVCLEASPRTRSVNRVVSAKLAAADGLADGFQSISHLLPMHLHEKLYLFSHPSPSVLVGSYNPSGIEPENPAIVQEIGDQDRGHNYLVEINDKAAVSHLREHFLQIARTSHGLLERYGREANEVPASDSMKIFYFPRRNTTVLPDLLTEQKLDRVQIATSHFRDSVILNRLAKLARSGTAIEILAHDTLRRVPPRIERRSKRAGIGFSRYYHPLGLPMHSKFILLSARNLRRVLFGSMNLTRTSRWLNHELLIQADSPQLFASFSDRWEEMHSEMEGYRLETAYAAQ